MPSTCPFSRDRSLFEQAKAVPILEVAQRLGLTLVKRGRETRIHCQDHHYDDNDDTHASCVLREQTNRFFCWSCGNRGSTIDLVMQTTTLTTPLSAARWLTNS